MDLSLMTPVLVGIGVLIGMSMGAVGAGGSILAVPALVYVAGQDAQQASASALVVVLATGLLALKPNLKAKRVRFDIAAPFAVTGVVGATIGKQVGDRANSDVLMLCLSALMVSAAATMAWKNRLALESSPTSETSTDGESLNGQRGAGVAGRVIATPGTATAVAVSAIAHRARVIVSPQKAGAVGLATGFLTGVLGVGGGFVIVPVLTLAFGVPMVEAVGTSLAIIVCNSAYTLALKAPSADFDWVTLAAFGGGAVVGAVRGSTLAMRHDGTVLTRWFVRIVLAVAAYVAVRSGLSLASA